MSVSSLRFAVFPQFFPAYRLQHAPDMVFTDFPSRIRIGYVLREPGVYRYVSREEVRGSGLTVAQLHEAALENLGELPFPKLAVARTPGGHEAWLVDDVDNFNAARILLPHVQAEFRKELGEPFLVAIPCRDWFFCWSTQQAAEWQAKNRAEAVSIFRADDYNLTPDIFSFSGGEFSLSLAQMADG
ncbi:MAG: DUF1444 family protein [Pirellulaceae bacterium]|nr:DUF1444 family protein [Pirellulaceae bacterium]